MIEILAIRALLCALGSIGLTQLIKKKMLIRHRTEEIRQHITHYFREKIFAGWFPSAFCFASQVQARNWSLLADGLGINL